MSNGETDYLTEIKFSKKHDKRMRIKIGKALAKSNLSRARYLTKQYLNSFHAKLLAYHEANDWTWSDLKKERKEILKFAREMNLWKVCKEKRHITLVPKKSKPDEARPIMRFGLHQRARQTLVRNVLQPKATFSIKGNQFGHKGHGGRKKAVEKVLKYLDKGFEFLEEIDIVSCFQQFNEEALPDLLHLPLEIVKNVVGNSNPYFVIHWNGISACNGDALLAEEPFASVVSEVQRGIPQGSCLSPLVSDLLFGIMDVDLPNDVCMINYCDNFLILAKSEGGVKLAAVNLGLALKGHPAGPLTQETLQTGKAKNGFGFLGYRFEPDNGRYRARPSDLNMNIFERKFEKRVADINSPGNVNSDDLVRIESLKRMINGWCGNFTSWDDIENFKRKHLYIALKLEQQIEDELDEFSPKLMDFENY